MDSPSYLPAPLASPALMVLASTAESGRDASVPCQAPRPFGVPVSVEKDLHLPFPSASYTFTSMYQRQGSISGAFPSRDFPASLLHLHPQFTPPNLDCSTLSMLSNHSGVGAFRPFSSPQDEREPGLYQSAFTPAKRLKSCFPEVEVKEFDFGSPGGSLKGGEDGGRKIFSMSGLLSDGEASSSPDERKEHGEYMQSMCTHTHEEVNGRNPGPDLHGVQRWLCGGNLKKGPLNFHKAASQVIALWMIMYEKIFALIYAYI